MKAMILAAGRGERLKPLTDTTPKPLLKIGSHCLIEYHLFKLAQLGFQDVVINVSYLKDAIMQTVGDGSRYGLNILYSIEEPQALETGGGIFQALQNGLLDDNPFLLLSADIFSDFPLENLPQNLQEDAYLVVVDNPSYKVKGDFGLVSGYITEQAPLFTYANIGVIHPRLFKNCTVGHFKLAPLLKKAIQANQVRGEHYSGPWFNIGTLEELKSLEKYKEARHETN